jgi:hypothetical protein
MSRINDTRARAVADLREGLILASVEVAASPERVFRALASNEILWSRSTGGRASRFGTWGLPRATCAARSRSDGKPASNGSRKSWRRSSR